MAGKYTERANRALALGGNEARRFNHAYLGTEHLFLGLVAVEEGVAAKALAPLGVDLPRVREAMMLIIGRGDGDGVDDPTPTPRLKQVLAAAEREAADLGHPYIGTEHLLLALFGKDEWDIQPSAAMRVLASLGLEPARVREQVLGLLGPSTAVARTRDHVVTCRVDERVLAALDALVEGGVYATRSEAAARLILAGLDANRPLLERVYAAVATIRQVRQETQALTREWASAEVHLPTAGAGASTSSGNAHDTSPPSGREDH